MFLDMVSASMSHLKMMPGTCCRIRFSDGSLSLSDTLEGAKLETRNVEDLIEKLCYTDETGVRRRWIPKRTTEIWGAASERRIGELCPSYATAEPTDIFWIDQRTLPSREVLERIDGDIDKMSDGEFADLIQLVVPDSVFRP